MDARRLGAGPARGRGAAAGAEASAATLANVKLAQQSALATAYFTLRQADSLETLLAETVAEYQRSPRSRRTSMTPARRPSPTSSPPRRRC